MAMLNQILLFLGCALLLWVGYKAIKANPNAFSKDNMNKSIFTLGILALFLIGFITLLVVGLRH